LFDLTLLTPAEVLADLGEFTAAHPNLPVLLVGNKQDAATPAQLAAFSQLAVIDNQPPIHFIAAAPRLGLEELQTALLAQVRGSGLATTGAATIVTNVRHARALEAAAGHLGAVQQGLATGRGTELLAADLRHALGALGEITGDISSDDLLTSIFTQFCIGK
jgi:tRNA modification GTPase